MSNRFELNKADLAKLGKSFLITLGGAALILISDALGFIVWESGSVWAAFAPFVANVLKRWGTGTRSVWGEWGNE